MLKLLAALCLLLMPIPAAALPPNIILVLVDDMSMNLMPGPDKPAGYMPNLAQLQADGMTFTSYIASNSLCCPSRASTFTGLLPHNTGVLSNNAPSGGYASFVAHGDEAKSFALSLQAAGYKTGFFGKYLNGYELTNPIPPGWNKWVSSDHAYAAYGYSLNNQGVVTMPADHFTDAISGLARPWMTTSRQPFFVELAPFSPHSPYVPATRHAGLYLDAILPKTPAFGATPDAAAPLWLREIDKMGPQPLAGMQANYVLRLQAMASIDEMLGAVRARLVAQGMAANTYVIFTSDNGLHMGEWNMRPGKMTPFDFDARAPLVIVGPGIAPGSTSDAIVQNIDLGPTFVQLATGAPMVADGRPITPLFTGGAWSRRVAVVEHFQEVMDPSDPDYTAPKAGDPPSYTAMRAKNWLYVTYATGEVGYYDMTTDPYQMANVAAALSPQRASALATNAAALGICTGNCGSLQDQPVN